MSAANPPPLPLWPANVRALAFTIDLLPKTPQASPRHIGCFEGQLCLCRCPELGRGPFQRLGLRLTAAAVKAQPDFRQSPFGTRGRWAGVRHFRL